MKNLRRPRRNILSRERAYKLLSPHFDDLFVPAIQTGLNRLAAFTPEQRQDLSARTKASMLNDYIGADLELRISQEELDINVNDDCGFRLFMVDDVAALRVKKVDCQSKPKNIQTEQQSKLELQLELPGVTKATIITLGYHLNELWDKVLCVKLICRLDGRFHWIIPVSTDPLQAMLFKDQRALDQRQRKARVRVRKREEA